ncbi:MAG: ribonuclease HII [Opitutales bacterium]
MARKVRPGLRLARFDRSVLGDAPGIVGVDEVGRGAWAGPVTAAAVRIARTTYALPAFRETVAEANDSKVLSLQQREALFGTLERLAGEKQIAFTVGWASCTEIGQHNIVGATVIAMRRAIEALDACPLAGAEDLPLFQQQPAECPYRLHIDGLPLRKLPWRHEAYTQGDSKSLAIALASIVAKVTRDRHMTHLDKAHPGYGFARNKAYPAPTHLAGLRQLGPCSEHRAAFLRKFYEREAGKCPEQPLLAAAAQSPLTHSGG